MKNSLSALISDTELGSLPIDMSLRPENLSLAEYALISDRISRARHSARQEQQEESHDQQ